MKLITDTVNLFNDKNKALSLIKGREDLKLVDKENIFSIRSNYFKGNLDKNIVDIYKEELEIFFFNNIANSIKLEDSPVYQFYTSLTFHLIDIEILTTLFDRIQSLAQQYNVYKPYDQIEHVKMFDTILNHKNKYMSRSLNIKIPYDVSAALATGSGSKNTGSTTVDKLYKINQDCSVSELIDIHYPLKLTDKMSIRLMNVEGVHKIYYSFKQDDPFVYIDDADFDDLIKQQFLCRYQSAVKKHLNIKNAEYNSDYITVLQMVKI